MFPSDLVASSRALLDELRARRLMIATAESCTGGLLAAVLTEIPGSSDVVDRGFITYSNGAKRELLGVAADILDSKGAVSRETALAMVAGAIARSGCDVAIAVTGVAGPGGGSIEKPVGLVHLAAAMKGRDALHRECRFGDIGRGAVRLATVAEALALIQAVISQ